MSVVLHPGDCLEVIPRLVAEGVQVDAVVCDPPYHLLPTVNRLRGTVAGGKTDVERRAATRTDPLGRLAGGFMGATWDGGDVAFRAETWATVATIMRPGAFLIAFGGTRTVHRLACAIEDAGFVIQDQIAWLYATGFPKHHTHLKPAHEPIVLAYKPGGKRTMQVDECRIGVEGGYTRHTVNATPGQWSGNAATGEVSINGGRWPANVCLEDCEEVVACFPQSAGQQGDVTGLEPSSKTNNVYGQFKGRPATKARREGEASADRRYTDEGASDFAMLPGARRSDGGSAARFFFSSKAGSEDRWGSKHPTVKPVELMKWLVQLVTPIDGTCLDPFAGSGTTGVAALAAGRDAILIEREPAYCDDIRARLAHYEGGGQHSMQAKNRNRKTDLGPLFADIAAD